MTIPDRHQELAAAYLAGEIPEAVYLARARDLIVHDLGLATPVVWPTSTLESLGG